MRIHTAQDIEKFVGEPDPSLWTVVIPAAGKGTRLGFEKAKILYPILGRTILDRLIDLLDPFCQHFFFVLSPWAAKDVLPVLEKRLPGKFSAPIIENSRGNADSLFQAVPKITTPYTLVIWGDQVTVSPETIRTVQKLHQSVKDARLTLPLVERPNPYVHYASGEEGRLVRVLERREGAEMPTLGESDCGVFAFDTQRLQEVFQKQSEQRIETSPSTGEWSLLPMLPLFEDGKESVNAYRLESIEETYGVNDIQEAELSEFQQVRKNIRERGKKLRVAMFSGGRGTGAITEALLKHPDIELTLLVNTYDDGLSTGLLRRFIPGMLGPSDVRKNISRFVAQRHDPGSKALHTLIEFRFPDPTQTDEALRVLREFCDLNDGSNHELLSQRNRLSLAQVRDASRYLKAFLKYYEEHIRDFPSFPFGDVSFGNLLFAGCYLECGEDFNQTVREFSRFAETGQSVLNITNGENRVLVAIKENGLFLPDEASVVGPQEASKIQEIFLLPTYLDQSLHPLGPYKTDTIRTLRNLESLPTLNPAAENVLKESDIIIYGPGTQYSSLFPSYLTSGVAETIQANRRAEKIFIGNIARDFDILGEDATTLVKAFLWYMGRKVEGSFPPQDVVTRFFFQKPEAGIGEETPYVPFDAKAFEQSLEKVTWIDFEGEKGKHSGSRTVSEILHVVETELERRLNRATHTVSIIVPALNEERSIRQVLKDLASFQFEGGVVEKEIIVVDGGSTDQTYVISSAEPGIRCYQLTERVGRGAALRLGIERAKGDITVFFPSDGEYLVEDLNRIVGPLLREEFPAVFGSRAFRTNDLSNTLKRVYGKKGLLYFISKYGGILLSILTLLLYQRFISDPFTSVKGFQTRVLKKFRFGLRGVDFDMELLAKLLRSGHMILEVPVSYRARTLEQGKKTTVRDGLACLLALFRFARWKPSRIIATPIGTQKLAPARQK